MNKSLKSSTKRAAIFSKAYPGESESYRLQNEPSRSQSKPYPSQNELCRSQNEPHRSQSELYS